MALTSFNIIQNKNSSQAGLTTPGLTGNQSIKHIPIDRIYIKTAMTTTNTVMTGFAKSNGITPTGWTDLGSLDGMVKVIYDLKVAKVTTGADEYLRGAYGQSKGGQIDFALNQVDDEAFALISGITPSVIIPGSMVSFDVGSTDLTQAALLMVSQNKLNGKEFQYFNPNAFISWSYDNAKDATVLKCSAFVPYFQPSDTTVETIFRSFLFA